MKNILTVANVCAGICFFVGSAGEILDKNVLTATIMRTGSAQIQVLGNLAINTGQS